MIKKRHITDEKGDYEIEVHFKNGDIDRIKTESKRTIEDIQKQFKDKTRCLFNGFAIDWNEVTRIYFYEYFSSKKAIAKQSAKLLDVFFLSMLIIIVAKTLSVVGII